MPSSLPAIRIATVIGTGAVAFLAGFSMSSASSAPSEAPPIVNPHAWEQRPAVAPPATVELTRKASPACNPWEVSDIAMEEILSEMQRRGWRPPRQGEAVASLETVGMVVDDPHAPMPGGATENYITVLSDEDAARLEAGDDSVLPQPPPS